MARLDAAQPKVATRKNAISHLAGAGASERQAGSDAEYYSTQQASASAGAGRGAEETSAKRKRQALQAQQAQARRMEGWRWRAYGGARRK
jgi:hypothetical protein